MKFEFLADRPEAAASIAQWYFSQWGHRIQGESQQDIEMRLRQFLNRDRPPLTVLATEGDALLGVAELKIREMAIRPQYEYWLGGVYVPDTSRNRGLASQLALRVARLAKSIGIEKLYLQTERLDGGLYARLGWRPLEQVQDRGLDVLIMEKSLVGQD